MQPPCDRKTLLRLLLAIGFYAKGNRAVGWYCLPKKYKADGLPDGFFSLVIQEAIQAIAANLDWGARYRQFTTAAASFKIGSTLTIRPPLRYRL